MRRATNAFIFIACLACASVTSLAQPTRDERPFLHPLFTDHAVLQRGVRFPVWGWTTPGARVKVNMRDSEDTATADAAGKWVAHLGPFDAGGPYTLTVTGPQNVTLTDVLVGDVWLASGQSNMEMGITNVNNAQQEVAQADYPRIRLFQVPKVAATTPRGTGMEACSSMSFVNSLSLAASTATELVWSEVAACMKRRCLPQPSRTMLPTPTRSHGIRRRAAASTMARVEGPSSLRAATRRASASFASSGNGSPFIKHPTSATAASSRQRVACSALYSTTTL